MLGRSFAFTRWCSGLISAVGAVVVLAAFLTVGYAPPAEALPSYARQTGQPCGTCHTDFAGLTPYGRLFKIQGYTAGGGRYRTTLFPGSDSYRNSYIPPIMVKSAPSPDNFDGGDQKTWVPPISAMVTFGLTNTQAPLSTIASLPTPAPYKDNNNITIAPLSFFWGGAITENIGAFAQVTYGGQPPGGFGTDPLAIRGAGITLISATRIQPRLWESRLHMALLRTITPPFRTRGIRPRLGRSHMQHRLYTTDLDPAR